MCGIVLAVTESGLKQSYKVKFLLRPRASLPPFPVMCEPAYKLERLLLVSKMFWSIHTFGTPARPSWVTFFFKTTLLVLSHSLDFSTDAAPAENFALLDHALRALSAPTTLSTLLLGIGQYVHHTPLRSTAQKQGLCLAGLLIFPVFGTVPKI